MTNTRALASALDAAGYLPAALRPLFDEDCKVRREDFIPDRAWVADDDGGYLPINRHDDEERWLDAVYSNRSIVTQFDDGATGWPDIGDRPTCSASMPSVVAGMLSALNVQPGEKVLEIGTGTGYNAALLGERVGADGLVTTVEVDPYLMQTARARLNDAGCTNVQPFAADGADGAPYCGPFDRVIATVSAHVGRIPYAWVQQTWPGGTILAPVRADLASGPLVRFTVDKDGTATGRVVPMSVGFMELRAQRTPTTRDSDTIQWSREDADRTTTRINPASALRNPAARWALAVSLPSVRYDFGQALDDGKENYWLRDPVSGSWASVVSAADGDFTVYQCGPRRLWNEAEAAYKWWVAHAERPLVSWEWTITPDRQSVILAR